MHTLSMEKYTKKEKDNYAYAVDIYVLGKIVILVTIISCNIRK